MMDFIDLSKQCAPYVDVSTMAAIVKTESAFKPYIISIDRKGKNAGSKNFDNIDDAVREAIRLTGLGEHIGVGLGQITDANIRRMGLSWKEAFDPCSNIQASASILEGNYRRAKPDVVGEQVALTKALSAYNTGSESRGISNGYVRKVAGNAKRLSVPAIQGANLTALPVAEHNRESSFSPSDKGALFSASDKGDPFGDD